MELKKLILCNIINWKGWEYIESISPEIFGEYSILASVAIGWPVNDVYVRCAKQLPEMTQEVSESVSTDAYFSVQLTFDQCLKELWANYIDDRYKKGNGKMDKEVAQKLNTMYDKIERINKNTNILSETIDYIDMCLESWVGYKTGHTWLDRYIWGLRPWTVTRLVWYSNAGKSRFMYSIMVNLLRSGQGVELFSLEVSRYMILINLVSAYHKIPTDDFEKKGHKEKIKEFYEKYKDKLTIHDDTYNIAGIEALTLNTKQDVVMIDFVQNITAPWEWTERLDQIATRIQQLAIRSKKPIFDLSQVSNDWAKYNVGDVIKARGSGALVFSADIAIVLQTENSPNVSFTIAKNKFWPKDMQIHTKADMGICRFDYVSDNSFWNV